MSKVSITVLDDFDGLTANVVEVIERTIKRGSRQNRKGVPHIPVDTVSYKGNTYSVFGLGSSYGVPHASCISIGWRY